MVACVFGLIGDLCETGLTESFPARPFFFRSHPRREACTSTRRMVKAMTRIEVKTQLGQNVVSREHGRKMRALLEKALSDVPPVVVDFEGMQITSVSFFDESFGVL